MDLRVVHRTLPLAKRKYVGWAGTSPVSCAQGVTSHRGGVCFEVARLLAANKGGTTKAGFDVVGRAFRPLRARGFFVPTKGTRKLAMQIQTKNGAVPRKKRLLTGLRPTGKFH